MAELYSSWFEIASLIYFKTGAIKWQLLKFQPP